MLKAQIGTLLHGGNRMYIAAGREPVGYWTDTGCCGLSWEGPGHSWSVIGGQARCQGCGMAVHLMPAVGESGGWGDEYFRPPFLDHQDGPCPGTIDPDEARRAILKSGIFVVHLWRLRPEYVSCWQMRIVGHPGAEHVSGRSYARSITLIGVDGLEMTPDGQFTAYTPMGCVTVATQQYGGCVTDLQEVIQTAPY